MPNRPTREHEGFVGDNGRAHTCDSPELLLKKGLREKNTKRGALAAEIHGRGRCEGIPSRYGSRERGVGTKGQKCFMEG